jgi:hypothetical protein
VRAWVEVVVQPRRFFRTGVAPGDQAPGLVFAGAVVLAEELSRYALGVAAYPVFGGRPLASAALVVALAVMLVTPATLHLTAALQTLFLIPFAPERGGVSETVQVLGYATAPCLFAGLPFPALRVACAAYGTALLVIGTGQVHDVSLPRAAVVAAIPAAVIFGYGFRGFAAASSLLAGAGAC